MRRIWMPWAWLVLAGAALLGCGAAAGDEGGAEPAPVAEEAQSLENFRKHGGEPRWYWFATGVDYEDPLRAVAHDRKGNIVAAGLFGGGLLIDSEGRHITGTGTFTALVLKFNPKGRLLWYRTFDAVGPGPSGDTLADVRAVAVDRKGDIFLAGVHSGTIDFGGGPLTGTNFLVKLDADGHHVWSRAFLADGDFEVINLEVDRDGDIIAIGIGQRSELPSVLVKLTSEGEERWRLVDTESRGPFLGLAVDDDENIYVGGGAVHNARKGFVLKVSARGEPRWSHTLDSSTGEVQAIAVRGDRVVLSGSFTGDLHFGNQTLASDDATGFVAALTRKGHERWARKTGTGARHYVDARECGDVVATGTFRAGEDLGRGPEPGDPLAGNIYAARFDPWDGDVRWVRTFPSRGAIPLDISVARDGSSAIVGVFIYPIDFGEGPIVPAPVQDDPFLLDLAP